MAYSFTRKNVYDGGDWADPILWYARGVKAMKTRPLSDPTSWNFYAAIHGIRRWVWDFYGFTQASDADPAASVVGTYWFQCQHQSWYFLPWHRGYLLALENQLREEIATLGGPADTWALPYWNYFGTNQNALPSAFRSTDWPDGNDNPLFVTQRWGPLSTATPFDVGSVTNLTPLGDPIFTGPGGGGSVGFGGPETGFNWNGGTSGGVEMNPHNFIHGLIGGEDASQQFPPGTPFAGSNLYGVMGDPSAAALDPIFYLHHCNIDRLWESWNSFPSGKPAPNPTDWKNPVNSNWQKGPANIGQRKFAMPKPDASEWVYTPEEMLSIANLGYDYQDLTPSAAAVTTLTVAARMTNLGKAAGTGGAPMSAQTKVEMIGASEDGLSLSGATAKRAVVRTMPEARARVTESLADARTVPDRVFLNLENITGLADATIFHVYVGLPEGADPADNAEHRAGAVSLFGVSEASDPAGRHGGGGINATLEITDIVDKLHLGGNFDVEELSVQIVPMGNISEAAKVRIGRISIYRQFD